MRSSSNPSTLSRSNSGSQRGYTREVDIPLDNRVNSRLNVLHVLVPAHEGDEIDLPKQIIDSLFEDELSCSICMDILDTTVATECLHRFCKECIGRHLRQIERVLDHDCPLCRVKINTARKLRKDVKIDEFINLFQAETLLNKKNMMDAIANAANEHKKNTLKMIEIQKKKTAKVNGQNEQQKDKESRSGSLGAAKLPSGRSASTNSTANVARNAPYDDSSTDLQRSNQNFSRSDQHSDEAIKKRKITVQSKTDVEPISKIASAVPLSVSLNWHTNYSKVYSELNNTPRELENVNIIGGCPIDTYIILNTMVEFSVMPHHSESFLWDLPRGSIMRTKGSVKIREIKNFVLSELRLSVNASRNDNSDSHNSKNSNHNRNSLCDLSINSELRRKFVESFNADDIDFYCNIPSFSMISSGQANAVIGTGGHSSSNNNNYNNNNISNSNGVVVPLASPAPRATFNGQNEEFRIDSSELTIAELNNFYMRRSGNLCTHLTILYTLYE